MSEGRLNVDSFTGAFIARRMGSKTCLLTTLITSDGNEQLVRLIQRKAGKSSKKRMAQKQRDSLLLGLKHPAIEIYRGELDHEGKKYDVFDAPELLAEDRLSERITPAILTDRLLDILPALEEMHAAGLVHGALDRSAIRTTQERRLIITGMDTAYLSDQTDIDLQALATYCANSLGAVPGIPVEVFLKTGSRRINRRLCSAIQGAFGEPGYDRVSSIGEFHDLIVGKTKPGPVLQPPILTENLEYASSEEDTSMEPTWALPLAPEITPTGIGLIAACALAILAVPYYNAGDLNPDTAAEVTGELTSSEVAEPTLVARIVNAEIDSSADEVSPQPVAAFDDTYFEKTWLSMLTPVSRAETSQTPEEALVSLQYDLETEMALFKAQTSTWIAPVPEVIENIVQDEAENLAQDVSEVLVRDVSVNLVYEVSETQSFTDTWQTASVTPSAVEPIVAEPVTPERVSGRVLSTSELTSLVGNAAAKAPANPAPVEVKLTASKPAEIEAPVSADVQAIASVSPQKLADAKSAVFPAAGQPFRDCADCPDMLFLPAISGSTGQIAMAMTEATVSQYRAFIDETGGLLSTQTGAGNRNAFDPGFEQTDTHPVTYVSLEDAQSYAAWLSKKTGQTYRLPTIDEWKQAASRHVDFSQRTSKQCELTNGADAALSVELTKRLLARCSDDFKATAPVRSFPANKNGLYDMIGNVAEWTSSPEGTDLHITKGGSWMSYGTELSDEPVTVERKGARVGEVGFRLVREIN